MSEPDSALLKLYQLSLGEKQKVAEAANNIIALIEGEKLKTSSEKEFTNFVQHLSNLKPFMTKGDCQEADEKVRLIMTEMQIGKQNPVFGIFAQQRVILALRLVLALPIDFSRLKSRKWKALLAAHSVAVETEK